MKRKGLRKTSPEYTSEDLKGLKVEHDFEEIGEGDTLILTLKDSNILDDADDVLENIAFKEKEKVEKNNLLKKKKTVYNPYDQEEFDSFGMPQKKSILKHYDEEDHKKVFVLGEEKADMDIDLDMKTRVAQEIQSKMMTLNSKKILLSDYIEKEEDEKVQFKRLKKKKSKHQKFKGTREDQNLEDNELFKRKIPNSDDDSDQEALSERYKAIDREEEEAQRELEKALERARQLKEKSLKSNSSSFFREHLQSRVGEEASPENAFEYSSTVEFANSISANSKLPANPLESSLLKAKELSRADSQNISYSTIPVSSSLGAQSSKPAPESDDDAEEIVLSKKAENGSASASTISGSKGKEELVDFTAEINSRGSIAAALALAKSKGYVEKKRQDFVSVFDTAPASLLSQTCVKENVSYEKGPPSRRDYRGRGDASGEGSSRNHRENEGPRPDLKDYAPVINLEYVDDHGKVLTLKEAFRELSHRFHGMKPGKTKTEKRMKKYEEAIARQKGIDSDQSFASAVLLEETKKASHQPFVVLSGNRSSQEAAIDISKPSAASTSKKKKAA